MNASRFLTRGIHMLTPEVYHADPAPEPSLSASLAKKIIMQSPLHAWTASPRLNPNWKADDKKAYDIGRVAHRLILGRGDEYRVIPKEILASNGAASTKEAKAFIEECREAGCTPIKEDEIAGARVMSGAVNRKLERMGMEIDPARSELAAIAELDGVTCRMLADNVPVGRPYFVDVKTTTDASVDAVTRAVTAYGYDLQAAHYQAVWEAVTGERRAMRFVFVEKEPPHEVSVVQLHDAEADDADWMLDARHKAAEARRIWGECITADYWPGYPEQVAVIGAPAWHRTRWADRPTGLPVVPDRVKKRLSPHVIAALARFQAPGGI